MSVRPTARYCVIRKWHSYTSFAFGVTALVAVAWCLIGYGQRVHIFNTWQLGAMFAGQFSLLFASLFFPLNRKTQ